MINDILRGISDALSAEFAYKVYVEDIPQGLKSPCFFVSCINPTNELFFWRRRYRTNLFSIQYFSEQENAARREMNDVYDRISECLEYITVKGDLVRGRDISVQNIEDGVMTITAQYNLYMLSPDDAEKMTELSLQQETKGVSHG